MADPVVEDNRPPSQPILLSAEFLANEDGAGTTTIAWGDVAGETGETYRVYRSDQPFSSILRSDVFMLVEGILEGINSYEVQVAQGDDTVQPAAIPLTFAQPAQSSMESLFENERELADLFDAM